MNIVETRVQNIRPSKNGHRMQGNVSFYISGGMGERRDIANYECSCSIPVGKNSIERMALIKQGLKYDAMQQARRMPEIRSGQETLDMLTPSEQTAA